MYALNKKTKKSKLSRRMQVFGDKTENKVDQINNKISDKIKRAILKIGSRVILPLLISLSFACGGSSNTNQNNNGYNRDTIVGVDNNSFGNWDYTIRDGPGEDLAPPPLKYSLSSVTRTITSQTVIQKPKGFSVYNLYNTSYPNLSPFTMNVSIQMAKLKDNRGNDYGEIPADIVIKFNGDKGLKNIPFGVLNMAPETTKLINLINLPMMQLESYTFIQLYYNQPTGIDIGGSSRDGEVPITFGRYVGDYELFINKPKQITINGKKYTLEYTSNNFGEVVLSNEKGDSEELQTGNLGRYMPLIDGIVGLTYGYVRNTSIKIKLISNTMDYELDMNMGSDESGSVLEFKKDGHTIYYDVIKDKGSASIDNNGNEVMNIYKCEIRYRSCDNLWANKQ